MIQRKAKFGLLCIYILTITNNQPVASAFQADLVNQAIQAASSLTSSSPGLDEIIFAAVNLLDSQNRPLIIFPVTEKPKEETISAPTYFYDDEITNEKSYFDDDLQPLSSNIELTEEEIELFQLVREVRDKHCKSTALRIAGGWCRDKLLNRETSLPDIDFVLDNKSGSEFARLMHDNLPEEAYDSTTLKEYDKTKSEHLNTASLRVGKLWVDFCQLRFEKYDKDSRVPAKTGIASVVEDAYRRDLTINSLYYNLNTNQIEDWTEQGLEDLRYRNIRTPTSPLYTLLEDPLRILRAIRFAAQLSFSMDPGLKKAALDKRVREILQQKVSRERMGKEINAIFQSRDPRTGVELLIKTKLADIVFPLDGKDLEKPPYVVYKAGYDQLFRVQTLASRIFTQRTEWDVTRRRYLWYAAFFKPFCDVIPLSSKRQVGSKQHRNKSILYLLLVKGLKRPTYDCQFAEGIIKGAKVLQKLLTKYDDSATAQALFSSNAALSPPQGNDLAEFRWLCYKLLKQVGPLWKESLILALASSKQYKPTEAVRVYDELVSGLENQLGLDDTVLAMKPLMNGSQIQNRALPGVKGESFKKIMHTQEKWQVQNLVVGSTDHHSSEEKEAALIDYLVENYPQYT